MRRVLADSTFLRVYVLLALALLLTFGLALLGVAMVDQVRREHHREQLAEVPMRLLVQQLSAESDDQRSQWLARRGTELDVEFHLHDDAESRDLGYFQRARLDAGRVLIETRGETDWHLFKRLPNQESVLEARLNGISEAQLRGLTSLLGEWLADPLQRHQRVTELSSEALPISLNDAPPRRLDSAQLTQLGAGEVILHLTPEAWGLTLFLQLDSETSLQSIQWLQVGPIHAFAPMPLSLSLLLLVLMLGVLAGIIYLIVRGVEARMARLELAATRIAGGHLDTRVKVESSDFLGRLGMAFNGMVAQVQALLRAQQEMIRAVSHELRTPVARIRFAVQMVEDMTDDAAIRRQLQGIDGDIEELDGLVDEILTYARLGSDAVNGREMEATLVDCRAMAERVIDALSPLHGHLAIVLAEGPEVEALAEARYLQRALQNLVANACRHARSRVVIQVQAEPRLVRIDVEDDGPGVPVGERQAIFKPFARLDDSRTRSSGGYGLGLSIVQKVMTWHGGSVGVDASPALGGARFTLLLPQRP
ncbi:ATP-binding protein [Halomonas sp. A11-A]|uniref:ATP-binding protein n=1 Tax=Halomonas sp. A11-A TaxID=2183985 RepID=UPI000D70B322|nr:ATP-binding protein [Halomonas sp. A11-A]PWV72052.1 two-component system sensor histidine kinase RstB [Halomonas sp. A11-A]